MSKSLKESLLLKWEKLDERFAGLQLRERILVAASLLLVLFLMWDLLIASPMQKQRVTLSARYEAINRDLKALSAQETVMVKALSDDPNAAKRREVARLERQLKGANEKLQAMSVGLIPAKELPMVLQDVLKESSRLELLGLRSLEPVKLQLGNARAEAEEPEVTEEEKAIAAVTQDDESPIVDSARLAEERIVGVYKYAVRISVKGSYFAVVDYLAQLEQLPWRFYWDFIDYEVDSYPQARIILEVYTLSVDKGVLGV